MFEARQIGPADERLLVDQRIPSIAAEDTRDSTAASAQDGEVSGRHFTPMLPVEVHCHGLGSVDFSEVSRLDLEQLDRHCRAEGVLVVPTLYLHRDRIRQFEQFMVQFHRLRTHGLIPRVIGIALEGPLLASRGGTPAATVWPPTCREWERLARLSRYGLLYIVLSPDALSPGSELTPDGSPDLEWIIRILIEHGLRPALGHFTKADPTGSAERIEEILEIAESTKFGSIGARVLTDHLFNDMPLAIRHAFRTSKARRERSQTLCNYDIDNWRLDNIAAIAGPVPGAIINGAAAGRLVACVNFDGEHVDLAIATRAAQLMDTDNTMLMTDRCDSARLGGQELHQENENSLWYQSNGVVAAGSQPLDRQMANARACGVSEADVWALAASTAYAAFGLTERPKSGSFVNKTTGETTSRTQTVD